MKHLLAILAVLTAFNVAAFAQQDCSESYDGNGDGVVAIADLLGLLTVFGDFDVDDDGIWDSQDACIDLSACNFASTENEPCAWTDAIGVCGGSCLGDGDADGICDDVDDCVGAVDECGVCNGSGPIEMVIESITILYDSVYAAQIDEWWVFEVGADTVMTFECAPAGWNQLGADLDGEAAYDQSGYSVSLSSDGSTVAIGAQYNDGNGSNAGHVRIYSFDGASWNKLGADLDGEAAGDQSGWSVSLSSDGSTVAIGAKNNDGNGSNAGQVRIYAWDGASWNQLGADLDGEADGDQSGYSVSLSSDGSTVAIGAQYNDGNGSNAGHVRIYSFDGASWNKLGADLDGEAAGDQSGWSVSLSSDGSTVAIGAKNNDGNGSNAGQVRIYAWDGASWNQLGADLDGEADGDQIGYSVSLSSDGSTVAIGAPGNDGNGSNAGHVRIYSFNGASWNKLGADLDAEAEADYNGVSVSLSSDGSTVAIGARYNDGNGSNAGHVRIYAWDGASWNQLGADLDGEAAGDQSGWSVSLSSDGSTVAIDARYNAGNGSNAGHVRIFAWDGASWNQLGADLDGEAAGDNSGSSVSLSSDGSTVAIGAKSNDGNGSNAGHVRIYALE